MPRLSLSLFGPFDASLDGDRQLRFRTRKAQALLIVLATETDAVHRRSSLMTLLWPEQPERVARRNFRQALYHLRRAIPPLDSLDSSGSVSALAVDGQRVDLDAAAAITVDVRRFEKLVEASHVHAHVDLLGCERCYTQLAEAATLYRGDFLSDFYLDDSELFEDWVRGHRVRLRRAALETLETLTLIYVRRGAYRDARRSAERQLELDNLRESGYRQLIEVLALGGEQAEALALYESYRRLLADELGMRPTRETTALYERISAGESTATPSPPLSVRGYAVAGEVGIGSIGRVVHAVQPTIGREVAIKVVPARLANDAEFIRRFEADTRTVAALDHPNIVPVYDYWREPNAAYLVMRLMTGGNLEDALSRGPLAPERVVTVVDQIAGALASAHERGVIHRNLKPANVLFDERGDAFLSDFSIPGAPRATTPYDAPEAHRNEPRTPYSDQYALGILLYEMFAGERAGVAPTVTAGGRMPRRQSLPTLSLSQRDLSEQIDAVIRRATAVRPAERFANVLEMAHALATTFNDAPPDDASGSTRTLPAAASPSPNPYNGLRAFEEVDADRFFGRDGLTRRLIGRLTESRGPGAEVGSERFLAVVGPSGSGKSSVIKAGLLPALREGAIEGSEHWFVAQMTPGAQPLASLETALLSVAVDPPPSLVEPLQHDERGLFHLLRRVLPPGANTQLLLIIDQFEELYTQVADSEERRRFVSSLLAALRAPQSPLRVVVALRADFYDRPLSDPLLGALFSSRSQPVPPLSPAELDEAVRGPARQVGVTVESGLMAAIAADVGAQPGALPLLQYMLTELFESRTHHTMSLAAYERLGGVTGALGRRAEALFAALSDRARRITRQLFLRLATLDDTDEGGFTRRRAPRAELLALHASPVERPRLGDESPGVEDLYSHSRLARLSGEPIEGWWSPDRPVPSSDSAVVERVLDHFGRARLLTFDFDPAHRQPTVEVAHEALLREWPRLHGWLAEGRDDLRHQRRLAAAVSQWREADREASFLLHGYQLEWYAKWAKSASVTLAQPELEFLQASLAAQEERQAAEQARRERELWTAQVLAESERARAAERAAAEAQAVARQREAETQARVAQSRELAAAAITQLQLDPELSILLALEALKVAPTIQAERALHQAVPASPVMHTLEGHQSSIGGMSWNPTRPHLAVVDMENGVHVWDTTSGTLVSQFGGHDGLYMCVAYSARGKQIVTGSDDRTAIVWNAETGGRIYRLVGHSAVVMDVSFSPTGRLLATASMDGTARLWELTTGREQHVLLGHDSPVSRIAFHPEGRHVATAGLDGTVRVWDVVHGEIVRVIEAGLDSPGLRGVAFSPDGRHLLAEGNGTALIWRFSDITEREVPEAHLTITGLIRGALVATMSFLPDGRLLGLSKHGETTVWDASTGEALRDILCRCGSEVFVVPSCDGMQLAVASESGVVKICQLGPSREVATLSIKSSWALGARFSPSGTRLYTVNSNGDLATWRLSESRDSAASLERLTTLENEQLLDIALSPEGERLATSSRSGVPRIWNRKTGKLLLAMEGHAARVGRVRFSPDGRLLATASRDGTARVWDTKTGEEQVRWSAHEQPLSEEEQTSWSEAQGQVNDVAFSPDGSFLVRVGADSLARILDAQTGIEVAAIKHEAPLWAVAFSPDSQLLATAGNAAQLCLWDFRSCLDGNVSRVAELRGHAGLVTSITFDAEGRRLASASIDGTAKVWDVETHQELVTLYGHTDQVWNVAFSPDGKRLATASWDSTVRLFTLDLEELVEIARSRVTRALSPEETNRFLHRGDAV